MKVTAEQIPDRQVVLTIEVEPDRVEKSLDRAYRRLVNKMNIPGFRRGKAPRVMVERFVGRSALLEEALEQLVPEVYNEAIKEQAIEAFEQPKLEIAQLEPVTVKATVPLKPEVRLGDYRAIRLVREQVEVSPEDVDRVIEDLRERQAIWEPVERPIAFGDRVSIELSGTRDGETIADHRTLDYDVRAESPAPAPGFAERLVGLAPGDEQEIALSFSPDDARPEFAGKSYVFQVGVQEVKAKRLPAPDDDFAKSLGSEEIETIEQLRERIADNLRAEREHEARRRYVDQVIDMAVEASEVEFPAVLVEREIDAMLKHQADLLAAQKINFQQYLRYLNKTEEDLRNDFRESARKRAKTKLVLEAVARAEELTVSSGEVDSEIAHLASQMARDQAADFQASANREAVERLLLRRNAEERLVALAGGQLEPEEGVQAEANAPPISAEAGSAE